MHVYIEKYQIFSKPLFAVKTARQSFGNESFDPGKSWICPGVEYQSCGLRNSTHAYQNLKIFDTWAERYEFISQSCCCPNSGNFHLKYP
jgi:hypothetical protein